MSTVPSILVRAGVLVALLLASSWSASPAASLGGCQVDVKSDADTTVVVAESQSAHAAVVVSNPGVWDAIPGGSAGSPEFIWANDDVTSSPGEAIFVRLVQGCAPAAAGRLLVNGDDHYAAFWNGVQVTSCGPPDPNPCFDGYHEAQVTILPGVNVLVIRGINYPGPATNPAMVQFRVTTA